MKVTTKAQIEEICKEMHYLDAEIELFPHSSIVFKAFPYSDYEHSLLATLYGFPNAFC